MSARTGRSHKCWKRAGERRSSSSGISQQCASVPGTDTPNWMLLLPFLFPNVAPDPSLFLSSLLHLTFTPPPPCFSPPHMTSVPPPSLFLSLFFWFHFLSFLFFFPRFSSVLTSPPPIHYLYFLSFFFPTSLFDFLFQIMCHFLNSFVNVLVSKAGGEVALSLWASLC